MDMLEKYKVVAKRYEELLLKREDVIGIMHLGGIARKRADEDSDIDIAVFSYEPLKNIKLGEQFSEEGYDVELFNIVINEGYDYWDPIMKEAYEEGFISTDKTGEVTAFMKKALEYKDDFRIHYLAKLIFKIAWHGWIYTPYRNIDIKGYKWILPSDLWFKRNDPENAYFLANICIQDFIELLFVLNRKWTPDHKWRLIKSRNLPILPSNYNEKINYLLFEKWDKETWNKKQEIFQSMIDEIIPLIIPDMPEDWYALLEH